MQSGPPSPPVTRHPDRAPEAGPRPRPRQQGGRAPTWALAPGPRTTMLPLPGDWAPSGRPCRTWTCFSRIRRLLKVRFPSVQYLGERAGGRGALGGVPRAGGPRPAVHSQRRGGPQGGGAPGYLHGYTRLMPSWLTRTWRRRLGAEQKERSHRRQGNFFTDWDGRVGTLRASSGRPHGHAGRAQGRPCSPPRSPCRAPSSCGPRTRHAQGTRSDKGHRSSRQGPHPPLWCPWSPGPAGAVWLDEGVRGSWALPPLQRSRTTPPQGALPLPETEPAPRAQPWGSEGHPRPLSRQSPPPSAQTGACSVKSRRGALWGPRCARAVSPLPPLPESGRP